MNQEIEAWNFLVSRNLHFDYRTGVAPDFVCDAKMTSLLARAAGGEVTENGKAVYRQILNSEIEDLTLVFRVIECTYPEMGIEGNGIVKDPFGREVRLIEGFVFKGSLSQSEIKLSQENFDQLRGQLKEHFRQFWEWNDSKEPAIPSYRFSFIKNEGVCLELISKEAYKVNNVLFKSLDKVQTIPSEKKTPHGVFKEDGNFKQKLSPLFFIIMIAIIIIIVILIKLII